MQISYTKLDVEKIVKIAGYPKTELNNYTRNYTEIRVDHALNKLKIT